MTIRKSSLLAISLSLFFVLAASQMALGQANLVLNPGFEDATNAPWTMWIEGKDAGAAAEMIIDNSESFTGNQSMLINIISAGADEKRVELHQKPFIATNGDVFTYAVWAKTESGKTRAASLRSNERADPWTTYASKDIEITDQWTEFWTPVEITADSENLGIYVQLQDTPNPARVWFDNFRLYLGDYVPEDIAPSAVAPNGKSTTTWATIKSSL